MKNIIFIGAMLIASTFFPQTKQNREISGFNELKVGAAIQVKLTMGDKESLVLEAEDHVLERIRSVVKDGQLHLYLDDKEMETQKDIIAYVTAKSLKELEAYGAAFIELTNRLNAEKLEVEASGAARMDLDVKVKNLELEISGAGKIGLRGEAQEAEMSISGAANVHAENLSCEKMQIKASGAGKAEISASKAIKVNASGASKVIYQGNPAEKNINTSGAASVKAG